MTRLAIGERSKYKQSGWPPNKNRDWQNWKNMAVLWRRRRSKHMIIDKRMHRKRERERACEWCRGVSSLCTLCVNTLPSVKVRDTLWLWYLSLHSSQLISSSLTSSHLKLWVKYLTSSNLFSSHFSSYVMHLAETWEFFPKASESWFNSIRSHCPKPQGNPFGCRKKNTFLPKPSTLLLWDCFASQKIGQKLKCPAICTGSVQSKKIFACKTYLCGVDKAKAENQEMSRKIRKQIICDQYVVYWTEVLSATCS